jgi:hypothetical protein
MEGRHLVRRRALGVAAVVALLAGAVCLAVLGIDVLRWRGHLEQADMRFATGSGTEGMWEPDGWFEGTSRGLLEVEDDLAFRRAIQHFRLSRPREPARSLEDVARRSEAEAELARVERMDGGAERRSWAATLRGGLALEEARPGGEQAGLFLRRSFAAFRDAVRLDDANEDAKFDLELVLQLMQTQQDEGGATGGRRGDVRASGAGAASSGSGY